MIGARDEEALDNALERLDGFGPDLANGMTSHAPMVVEALCVLGRGEAAEAWLERNQHGFTDWPARVSPIPEDDWRGALGRRDRVSDWRAMFDAELARRDWREVLDLWCSRLAAGAAAAATHGLIRVGHAARSLARRETEARRRELAGALALWASCHETLPAAPPAPALERDPARALAHVVFLPADQRCNGGSITAGLRQLAGHPPFAEAINLLAPPDDIDGGLRDLVDLFARVFLANARTSLGAVVFTHGVTVFGAVGALAPSVSPATTRTLFRHAWHAAAGLYAAYGEAGPLVDLPSGATGREEAIARAVAHGDDHVIKLTEACLTWERPGAPPPRLAAALAADLLPVDPGGPVSP